MSTLRLALLCLLAGFAAFAHGAESELKLLFLGDRGHHRPASLAAQLIPVLNARGIQVVYTEDVGELNSQRLAQFDGLIVYANIDEISPPHAKALLDYVASGKGFIPLHCASYCFRNNDEIVALIGGQFQRHGTGIFRVAPTGNSAEHPLMKGYRGFESWDETYVHTKHNEQDRTVLEYRVEGDQKEPWTWVRTHGRGRVFYTAWGHDERTWSNPGFRNLVERGIRWACGQDPGVVPPFVDRPEITPKRTDLKPVEFVEATIPFYPPSKQWGKLAEPVRKMQKPLPAEESVKHFRTPVGFHVELFADEPHIGKPLAMNWDERGRLWLCETVDYPNDLREPGQGNDRIRICEDTDGDRRADKFTVFAEGLSIPTAIAFYRGGAVVQDGSQTLFLRDTNGDDKADEKEVLITGWALNDTHGGVSNFRYGLDNWYYAMQGYNNSEPVYDGGRKKSQPFRMGFFRFKIEGGDSPSQPVRVTDIEFLRSTNNNTWGLGLSEEGVVFGSTANGNPSEYMPIANRYYERVRGWSAGVLGGIAGDDKIEPLVEIRQVDHHGGFTAAAGHALYTARSWPREYWNRTAFVCEPTAHLIATFVIQPEGAGYRSKNSWNIVASDDDWSAPIMAEVGPDGQLWFIDWYNIIVQHNPTPAGYKTGKGNAYEIDLRDKKHGRIYRVVYDGVGPEGKPSAPSAPDLKTKPARLAALSHDNQFWRLQAQRLLVEAATSETGSREAASEEELLSLVAPETPAGKSVAGLGLVHALRTADGASAEGPVWEEILWKHATQNPDAAVRRTAVQLLAGHWQTLLAKPSAAQAGVRAELEAVCLDREPQVRLAAALSLADSQPMPAIATTLARLTTKPEFLNDRWSLDALTSAAASQGALYLAELLRLDPQQSFPQGGFDAARDLAARVSQHVARGGDLKSLPTLMDAMAKSANRPLVNTILAGMSQGWPKDVPGGLDAAAEKSLLSLFERVEPEAQANLVVLATRWGSKQLEKHAAQIAANFLALAQDESREEAARIAAAKQLIEFRKTDEAAAKSVLDLISPRTPTSLGQGFLSAVSSSEVVAVGALLADRLPTVTPQMRATGLRALMERAEWTPALLDAVETGRLQLTDLSLDQKQALAAHPNRKLAERAKKMLAQGGGLPNPDRQKVLDEWMPITKVAGNAAAGKEVFKKQCSKCHIHSGEGTKIGPELTGMNVHPKHELLIHMLDPSRSVEGNFRVYTVALADGRVLTGLLASESKTAIEVVDSEAKKHPILREDIEELVASPKSLMPEGFEKQVTKEELTNLLEFLTQRGKYLPIPINKAATVVTTKGMFFEESGDIERLIFADWTPKTFEGVPFVLVDPEGNRVPNAIMLNGPHGRLPPKMPRSVTLPCNAPAKAIHFLSGVSGWGFPAEPKGGVSLIVRLTYADGSQEDHQLINGEHFADYIRRVDVPGSKFAFPLRGQQIRYLTVLPKRSDVITQIELVKGSDRTAPVVMALTVEAP